MVQQALGPATGAGKPEQRSLKSILQMQTPTAQPCGLISSFSPPAASGSENRRPAAEAIIFHFCESCKRPVRKVQSRCTHHAHQLRTKTAKTHCPSLFYYHSRVS